MNSTAKSLENVKQTYETEKNILLREKQVFAEKWEKKWNKLKLKYELLIMNLTDDLEQESPRDAPFNRFSSSPEKKRGGTRKAITRKNKH
jgi:hypothetical protein